MGTFVEIIYSGVYDRGKQMDDSYLKESIRHFMLKMSSNRELQRERREFRTQRRAHERELNILRKEKKQLQDELQRTKEELEQERAAHLTTRQSLTSYRQSLYTAEGLRDRFKSQVDAYEMLVFVIIVT